MPIVDIHHTVSVKVRLDTRKPKANTNLYPIKLFLYHNYETRAYRTSLALSKEDWSRINADRLKDCNLKNIRDKIQAIEMKAKEIIEYLGDSFSFGLFYDKYYGKTKIRNSNESVFDAIKRRGDRFLNEGSIGNAQIHYCTMRSLQKFSKSLKFKNVTVDFLNRYEKYMLVDKKSSPTTLSIYLRCLRSVLNDAVSDKIIPQEAYPFGKAKDGKYEMVRPKKKKRALTDEDIRKIINYEPTRECDAKGKDLWLFIFFANGMNVADMVRLKFKDIQGGFFTFFRQKTKRTRKDNEQIKVFISPEISRIIDRWGSPDKAPENYVFPFIDWSQSPEKCHNDTKLLVRNINDRIQDVGKALGISTRLTTYVARHSFGTVLMRQGVSTAFISKSYGHASLATTTDYLGDFTEEQIIDYGNILSNFAKGSTSNQFK